MRHFWSALCFAILLLQAPLPPVEEPETTCAASAAQLGFSPEPYDVSRHHTPHGGPGAGRELSFLAERCTVLYFCTRADLEIRPIPRGST